MAATVNVQEANGATPTYNTVTAPRFCTDDNYNPGSANPIPIPAAAFNYSFWKHLCLEFTGTFTSCSNIRHYCDGTIGWTLGTAGEVRRGNRDTPPHGCPSGSYDQATGTVGTTGDDLETHTYYSAQTVKTIDIEGDVVGTPASIDDSTYTTPGDRSYFIVLQVKVDTDATQGAQTAEQFTFLYDEI